MSGVAVRHVEVRTWPHTLGLFVIDPLRPRELVEAYHSDDAPFPNNVAWNPAAPYEQRARKVLENLEQSQDYLRMHFNADDEAEMIGEDIIVRLALDDAFRVDTDQTVLQPAGLSIDETGLSNIDEVIVKLETMPLEQLFELLCNWSDSCMMHRNAGVTLNRLERLAAGDRLAPRERPGTWAVNSQPAVAAHFQRLSDDPYGLFRQMIDIAPSDSADGDDEHPSDRFDLGKVIWWVYYHRTEFAGVRDRFPLRALAEAKLRSHWGLADTA